MLPRMSKEEQGLDFIYEIDGPDRIDVFELAPVLLSVGSLVRESNEIVHPGGPSISVDARPFREGSFLIDLYLVAQAGLPLLPSAVHAARDLIEVIKTIGLVRGLPGNFMEAVRVLRGRPTRVEETPNGIRYSVGSQSITVNGDVHQLIQNPVVRENASRIVRPLADPAVRRIRTYIPGQQEETEADMTRDDLDAFEVFGRSAPPQLDAEIETTNESIVFVHPRRGPYDGQSGQWSFWKGNAVQPAVMHDERFLEECATGRIRLHATDLLRVRLIERQRISGTRSLTTWEIPEVLEYRKGPSQRFLPGIEGVEGSGELWEWP